MGKFYELFGRKARGLLFTFKAMGPYYVFREAIRRLFGTPYSYHGIEIRDVKTFRLINGLLYLGINFSHDGFDYFARTKYGIIYGKDLKDLENLVIHEDLEGDYSSLNAKDNVVIDVGAYHGETALMFLNWGAKIVYAYEPVPEFYNYLIKTIKANGVENKVKAFNYGWWFSNGTLKLKLDYTCTGSLPGNTEIRVVNLVEELLKISREVGDNFVVKMDCEGCEYSLLTVPCEVLRLARQYVIEVHGALTPLIYKFINCGFKYEVVRQVGKYLFIVNFTRD